MAVIFVALAAGTIGGLLVTALAFIPQKSRCALKNPTRKTYNICVLYKGHEGQHSSADGHRF